MLAEGEPVPFELVRFGQVFKESSTRQQRKQLLNLFVSKVTIDKSRAIDTIELQINEYIINYLIKDELPNRKGDSSFFYLFGMNCVNVKIVI